MEAHRRHLLPSRAASAVFWRLVGDGAAIEHDAIVRRIRFGDVDLVLELPLRYHQNWSIALGQMPAQDRLALTAFARAAKTASASLDVGMNAGSYLYTAIGHRRPGATVVGFEPDEAMSSLVRRNIVRNDLHNVTIETCAVSAASGTAQLHRASSDQMHSLEPSFLERISSSVVGQEEVATVSIDDFVAERGLEPDLIKIDVEGHEATVIRGARSVLDDFRPTLIVELGSKSADGELFERLLRRGYSASLLAGTAIPVRSRGEFLSTRRPGFENYLFSCHG
jgi:FkbM family methyltransferase